MKVHLKDVRISFANIFEAKQVQGQGDAKFSGSFLFPRTHPAVAVVVEAMTAAAKEKWGVKADEVIKALKAGDRLCLHDGDSKPDADAYPGNLFLNASNKTRPLVIGPQREPLVAADGKPYSGCYVNAIVEIWPQDNQFGKRINASLLGVQFLRDGTRLAGGGVAAADDFEAIPQAGVEKAATSGEGAKSLF
jgi:hypothetical protein